MYLTTVMSRSDIFDADFYLTSVFGTPVLSAVIRHSESGYIIGKVLPIVNADTFEHYVDNFSDDLIDKLLEFDPPGKAGYTAARLVMFFDTLYKNFEIKIRE